MGLWRVHSVLTMGTSARLEHGSSDPLRPYRQASIIPPPWPLSFLSETKTWLTLQFLSCLFLSSFWEIRRSHIVQVAPSKRTSSTTSVSSHLACSQDGMGEGREGIFWISALPDSSSRGKCYSAARKLACPRYLAMLTKDAWDLVPERLPQLRTRWCSSMTRLLSRSRDLILLSCLSRTHRAIVSPICSLLSASKGWRTAKAVCWGRWCKKTKLIANHRLRRTEIQAPRLVILSFLLAVYLVGTS